MISAQSIIEEALYGSFSILNEAPQSHANFILTSLAAAGFVIVPRHATTEMTAAVYGRLGEERGRPEPAQDYWQTMIQASPDVSDEITPEQRLALLGPFALRRIAEILEVCKA